MKRSVWAVLAGLLVVIVVTTAVDTAMHVAGVFPPEDQPLTDALALLATAYRVVISVAGVVTLGASMALGFVAKGKNDDANGLCNGNVCTSERGVSAGGALGSAIREYRT